MGIIRFSREGVAALLLALLIIPATPLAAEFKEKIPIRIQINIDWNHRGSGNTRTSGTFMVNVTGNAKLTEEEGEFLRYEPAGMQATGKFKQETIQEAPGFKCTGQVINRAEGFGNVSITSEGPDMSTGGFLIDVNLGHLGKVAAMQYRGDLSIEGILDENKDSRSDNYSAFLTVPFNVTYRGLCDTKWTKEGKIPIGLTIFKELTHMGMHGSYTWRGDEGLPALMLGIGDFKGDKRFRPAKGQGARYRVNWAFGEVKPIVQIWRRKEDGEEANITDRKNQDVLVGQKVKLEAVVKPHGMSLDKGQWEIEGYIVDGWEATKEKAEVKPFKDHSKSKIGFSWVDGAFTGAPRKVKYSGEVNGKTVEAKTTINVFKPRVTKIVAIPSKKITVGYPVKPPCELFLGKRPANKWPGMKIISEIKMPILPEDKGQKRPHLLQYVQRIKEDLLEHYNRNYFRQVNTQWCCDKNYPYGGEGNRAPYKLKMDDSPGSDLGQLHKELHRQDEFETYLMFMPSANAQDPECVWVPLKMVRWGWAAAVKLKGDFPRSGPCNASTYELLYKVPPKPKKADCSTHPEWSCNVEQNTRQGIGFEQLNDGKWKELKAGREKRWKKK